MNSERPQRMKPHYKQLGEKGRLLMRADRRFRKWLRKKRKDGHTCFGVLGDAEHCCVCLRPIYTFERHQQDMSQAMRLMSRCTYPPPELP